MVDMILDWWDELGIKSRLIVLSVVSSSVILLSAWWTVYIGVNNTVDSFINNRFEQTVVMSKDSFYKSYSVQKQKQEEEDRKDDSTKPGSSSGVGEFTEGDYTFIGVEEPKIPYYTQGDPKWGSYAVRGGTIADSGCGLTSIAMIKTYLTGTYTTPIEVYEALPASDFQGSMGWDAPLHTLQPLGYDVVHFGQGTYVTEAEYQRLLDGLENGAIGLVSFKPGDFTRYGHIAVVKCTDGGTGTWINDPNGKNKRFCEAPVPKELMMANAKQFWLITK